MNMKWRVILEQDPETGDWAIWCPELPGCVSAGHTEEEALKNILEAIDLYLKKWSYRTCTRIINPRRSIRDCKSRTINLRITIDFGAKHPRWYLIIDNIITRRMLSPLHIRASFRPRTREPQTSTLLVISQSRLNLGNGLLFEFQALFERRCFGLAHFGSPFNVIPRSRSVL